MHCPRDGVVRKPGGCRDGGRPWGPEPGASGQSVGERPLGQARRFSAPARAAVGLGFWVVMSNQCWGRLRASQ